MILEKETFDKFGYKPKDLNKWSKSPIIANCSKCNKKRQTSFISLLSNNNICKRCTVAKASKGYKEKRLRIVKSLWLNSIHKSIKPSFLLYLYSKTNVKKIDCLGSRNKTFSKEESILIFKGLGLKKSPKSTTEYKLAIKRFYKKQNIFYKLSFLNELTDFFKTRYQYNNLLIGASWKNYSIFFENKLNFNIYPSSKNSKGCIVIKSGSLFKDGRWIHIG